jgi:hypothetical protein
MRARVTTTLMMTCLLLMACVAGTGQNLEEQTETSYIGPNTTTTAWGVSYDWSELPGDIKDMTGIDIEQILLDLEDAALDGHINLDLEYGINGTTYYYVVQSRGESKEIDLAGSGGSVDVDAIDTTITLRMAVESTMGIDFDWSEDDVGFDFDLDSYGNNAIIIDIQITEYYTDDFHFAGMDLNVSGGLSYGSSASLDADIFAGTDHITFENTTVSMTMDYTITKLNTEWRMEEASTIYEDILSGEHDVIHWYCDSYYDESQRYVWAENTGNEIKTHLDLIDACGEVDYSWDVGFGYELSLSNFPASDLGFTSDQASFSLSDSLTESGRENGESVGFSHTVYIVDHNYEIVGADGTTKEVVRVESGGPMSSSIGEMLGMGMALAIEDSDFDDLDEDLEEAAEEWEDDYDEGDDETMDIAEDFEDTDIEEDMEEMAEEVEEVMEDVEDDMESKYSDVRMYWLIDKETGNQLGPQLLVLDSDDEWVQLMGPDGTDIPAPSEEDSIELEYHEGEEAEEMQEDIADLSEEELLEEDPLAPDADAGGEDDMMMYLMAGGITIVVILVLGILGMMLMRRNRDENMWDDSEQSVNQAFNQIEMGGGMVASSGPPVSLAPPSGPPVTMQGVVKDGVEWAEYPPSSGTWYYRDSMTNQWVRHG